MTRDPARKACNIVLLAGEEAARQAISSL